MNKLSQKKAEAMLKPFLQTLQKCIKGGWCDYQEQYTKLHHIHEARTKAGIIRDHIVKRVKESFDGIPGISMFERNNLFLLGFFDQIFIRFKKLDDQLKAANIPTQQVFSFNYHQQLKLPNMPPDPLYLNAGYIPDEIWNRTKGAYIACPIGDAVEWSIDLIDNSETEQLPIDHYRTIGESRQDRLRVKPKQTAERNITDATERKS